MNKINLIDLKNQFPNSNFDWINNNTLQKIINLIPNEWRFVGGCVRDSLLGKFEIQNYKRDIDINTICSPDEILNSIKDIKGISIFEIGKKFGTISVYFKTNLIEWQIEITTLRIDIETYGRHAKVQLLSLNEFNNIDELFQLDCERRDFTINGLMYKDNYIIDHYNGIDDLLKKRIIFIGNAQKRIEEDYLRIIRYIRFAARFTDYNNWQNILYEKNYFIEYFDRVKTLSQERIISEIDKMLKLKTSASFAIELMNYYSLSNLFFKSDLNTNIIDNVNYELQFTILFLNTPYNIIKDWKFNREVQKNIMLLQFLTDSIILLEQKDEEISLLNTISYIWKIKGVDLAKNFILLYNIKYINNIYYKKLLYLLQLNWEKPIINFEIIPPKLRGIIDQEERLKYFQNIFIINNI